jgi:5-deoxy-glucuronate isomerase
MIEELIRRHRDRAFKPGWNHYLQKDPETEMSFAIYKMAADEFTTFETGKNEMAFVVLSGQGVIKFQHEKAKYRRASWIDENPFALHLSARRSFDIIAEMDTELAVCSVANEVSFPSKLYLPDEVSVEERGKGTLDDASFRLERLIFDHTIAPEPAHLVVGEVVNLPGRWSSYPPHQHPQPKLCYYRFDPEHGYGHSELGDDVFKIKHNDLLKVTDARNHSQVSAPGFHMYYLWIIRHLPGNPYTGFEVTPR